MKYSTRDIVFWIALGLITAFGAWLRLHGLGFSQLWLDEIWTAVEVAKGPWEIVKFTIADKGPLPLAYLLPWIAAPYGPPELVLRVPDALLGIMTIPLAASCAWRLGRSRIGAIAAATIVAVSDQLLWYSREARGYALLAFLALLAFRLLIEALESGRLRWWIGVFCCGLAGHYTSYFYCFTPPSLALWGIGWLMMADRRGELPRREILRRARNLAWAVVLPTVLFIPWLILSLIAYSHYKEGVDSLGASGLIGVWLDRVMLAWLPAAWGWRLVAGGLIVAGEIMLPRARRGLLVAAALTPIVVASQIFAISTTGHFLAPRYLIAALPLVAVAAGLGFAGMIEIGGRISYFKARPLRRKIVTAMATIAAAVLMTLNCRVQLWGYFNQWGMMQKQDWLAASALIQKYIKPGDRIVPGPEATYLPLDYYFSPELKKSIAPKEWGTAEYMTQHVDAFRASGLRVWYVAPGYVFTDKADMQEWFDENFKLFAVIPGLQSSIRIYVGPKAKSGGQ